MSLLMDALRRAEQEKRQQAQDAEPPVDTNASPAAATSAPAAGVFTGSEDVTIQIEAAELERAGRAGGGAGAAPVAGAGDASAEFSLDHDPEPVTAPETDLDRSHSLQMPDDLTLEPLESPAAATASDSAGAATPSADSDATGNTTLGQFGRVDQTQTMPSSRAVENDLNAYFDHSQSMEMPRGQAAGDVTLEDVAAHTVVGAQTVFAAGERPRRKPWLMLATGVAVLTVIGIGVIAVFYAQQSPQPRYLPPPTVADGVERPVIRELPVVPLEPSGTPQTPVGPVRIDTRAPAVAAAPETLAESGSATVSTAPPPASAVPFEPAPAVPVVSAQSPQTVATPAPAAAAPAVTTAASVPAPRAPVPTPAPIAEPVAPAPVESVPPVSRGIGRGELTIGRATRPAQVDSELAAAFAAYEAGDLKAAETAYAAVLARQPTQRDALLGRAAVALAEGRLETAFRAYRDVLKAHPDDAVATAALLSLSADEGGNRAARLRVMLDRYPDAPYLHFALGNWYARQARWGNAQQAYFDALRLDTTNADYAFNLAVSLDQMGQEKAALRYYRQCLTLADNNPGRFNPATVLERINALSAQTGG